MSSQLGGVWFVLALAALLAQVASDNHEDSRDLLLDVSWAANATHNLAAFAAATQASFVHLRECFRTDVAASSASLIDTLDTIGVIPRQLLELQGHVLATSSATDDLLEGVLTSLINYQALAAHVNEHLIFKVTALSHDLAQLIEDADHLILLMDSSLDFAFSRYDLQREMVLDLAHSFSGQEVEEIEDLLNQTDEVLIASYTTLSLNKFAFESHFQETVVALRSLLTQIHELIY